MMTPRHISGHHLMGYVNSFTRKRPFFKHCAG
jgi:hypothetical protein